MLFDLEVIDWTAIAAIVSFFVLLFSVSLSYKVYNMQKRQNQPYFEKKGTELEGFIDNKGKWPGLDPCNIKLHIKNTGGRTGAISKIHIMVSSNRNYYFDEYIENDFKKIRPNATPLYEFKKTNNYESAKENVVYLGLLKKDLSKKERIECKIENRKLVKNKRKEYGFEGSKWTLFLIMGGFCLINIEYYDYEDVIENKSDNSEKIRYDDLKTTKYETSFKIGTSVGSREKNGKINGIKNKILDKLNRIT